MTPADITRIEEALAVRLPEAYRTTMVGPVAEKLGESGVFDDAELVIERTREQRKGYGGAAPWPSRYVYVGDQEDACPYAMDCETGVVIHSDHGSLSDQLGRIESVEKLTASLLDEKKEQASQKNWWAFWKK
jgi:hypothetical protein